MIIAPAALSLSTKSASCAGTKSLYMREPYVVRIPAVNARSLTANGKPRSEEHTSELQSRVDLVCRLLLEKKKKKKKRTKKEAEKKEKKKTNNITKEKATIRYIAANSAHEYSKTCRHVYAKSQIAKGCSGC